MTLTMFTLNLQQWGGTQDYVCDIFRRIKHGEVNIWSPASTRTFTVLWGSVTRRRLKTNQAEEQFLFSVQGLGGLSSSCSACSHNPLQVVETSSDICSSHPVIGDHESVTMATTSPSGRQLISVSCVGDVDYRSVNTLWCHQNHKSWGVIRSANSLWCHQNSKLAVMSSKL